MPHLALALAIVYFNDANCITSNLGGTLKGKNLLQGSKFFPIRVAPNEEGEGLRLSHEKVYPFPSRTEQEGLKALNRSPE